MYRVCSVYRASERRMTHSECGGTVALMWTCRLLLAKHLLLCPVPQIAPAENPEVTERMVIITGPPEAQFKVRTLQSGVFGGRFYS